MEGLYALGLVVGIVILLFMACRAIVLWYWRVNEGIALLKSIDEKLDRLSVAPTAQVAPVRVAPAARPVVEGGGKTQAGRSKAAVN
jgi:hypothetical protein